MLYCRTIETIDLVWYLSCYKFDLVKLTYYSITGEKDDNPCFLLFSGSRTQPLSLSRAMTDRFYVAISPWGGDFHMKQTEDVRWKF